jgi:hypothetical protein
MLANSAIGAALVMMAAIFWLLGQTAFLVPYRRVIFHDYGWLILAVAVLTYLNLVAAFYLAARTLYLRTAGRKLIHVDRALEGPDTISPELSAQLTEHLKQ